MKSHNTCLPSVACILLEEKNKKTKQLQVVENAMKEMKVM